MFSDRTTLRHCCLQERPRHVLADDRGRLKELPVVWWQPIDARGQDRADGRRNLESLDVPAETERPMLPNQPSSLDERTGALFQEEGITAGPFEQQPGERPQRVVITEEATEKILGARRRQGIEAELRVARLADDRCGAT
jgi:hypothetical protein